jgi:ComF family protein
MSLGSILADLVYPRWCVGCGVTIGSRYEGHICWDCLARLNVITDPFCTVCGDPITGMVEHKYACSWCLERRPHFDLARSAVLYRGVAQTAIQSLKYRQMTCLSRDLAVFLTACITTHYAKVNIDAVSHVPLHAKRERERTYNQAKLLADIVASELRVPLMPNCMRRIRGTATQTELSASERRRNVAGAFEVMERPWIEGRNILLIDDVMTTGATVNECAKVLKKAGAAHVYVATVARG